MPIINQYARAYPAFRLAQSFSAGSGVEVTQQDPRLTNSRL
jgi:hypothetical protein